MGTFLRTKEDIEFHRLGFGYSRTPAVNVKIYETWNKAYQRWRCDNPDADPNFTEEWIEENISEDRMQGIWEHVVECGWDELQDKAEEIYGKHVKVYSEGRSGGWAYIEGINTDTETWDAIEFGMWRSFHKYARATANDIMWQLIDSIYINDWEAAEAERIENAGVEADIAIAMAGRRE